MPKVEKILTRVFAPWRIVERAYREWQRLLFDGIITYTLTMLVMALDGRAEYCQNQIIDETVQQFCSVRNVGMLAAFGQTWKSTIYLLPLYTLVWGLVSYVFYFIFQGVPFAGRKRHETQIRFLRYKVLGLSPPPHEQSNCPDWNNECRCDVVFSLPFATQVKYVGLFLTLPMIRLKKRHQ